MTHRIGIAALAGLLGLGLTAECGAQYGWNGWGGGTVGGNQARGMGVFAAGAGSYNQQTAQARSVNANTTMQLNEYLYQSEQVRKQQYYQETAAKNKLEDKARQELQDKHLNNPDREDIISGDAENALYHWLTNPKIPQQALASMGSDLMLTSDEVRKIPLESAAQGVVISIERLAAEDEWPASLSGPSFRGPRDQYKALVQKARALPEGQAVPDEIIDQGIALMQQMRSTAKAQLQGPQFAEAERYLKGHVGLLQMARQTNIREVLEKVKEVKEVPLANALNFMEVYNLQFGKANDPDESMVYLNSVYPKLAELRSRLLTQTGGEPPAPQPGQGSPTAIFNDMTWEHMTGQPSPPAGQ